MSSAPPPSRSSLFFQSPEQYFHWHRTSKPSATNVARPTPSSSSIATRIIAPKPFYRSLRTPEPFEYSPSTRRQSDSSQYSPNVSTRRYSMNQGNGSPVSRSYGSEYEPASPTMIVYPQPRYRSVTPMPYQYKHANRPVASVNPSPSPVLTRASRTSPTHSDMRFPSSPKPIRSNMRRISFSRPNSPSISMNGQYVNKQPMMYSNGHDTPYESPYSAPTNPKELPASSSAPSMHIFERTSPAFRPIEIQRDSPDHRYASNRLANRYTPSMGYPGTPSSVYDNAVHRPVATVNRQPASYSSSRSTPTPFAAHNGNTPGKEHAKPFLLKNIPSANFFGMCGRCNHEIIGEENRLVVMEKMYHVSCFMCAMCGCHLRAMHFYSMEDQPYCESCYINSLEKCAACSRPITDRILRATGKPYHAQCFACCVCQKSLDGIPFTIDVNMKGHCIDCFHQKFAPRCYACQRAIVPVYGQEETMRIVAFDRNYHLDCYRCEICSVPFTSEQGSYRLDDHICCIQCHRIYSTRMPGRT